MTKSRDKRKREKYIKGGNNEMNKNTNEEVIKSWEDTNATDLDSLTNNKTTEKETESQVSNEMKEKEEKALIQKKINAITRDRAMRQRDVYYKIFSKSNTRLYVYKKTDMKNLFIEQYIYSGKLITEIHELGDELGVCNVNTTYNINGKPLQLLSQYEMDEFVKNAGYSISKNRIKEMYLSTFDEFINYLQHKLSNYKIIKTEEGARLHDIGEYRVTSDLNGVYVDGLPLKLVDITIIYELFRAVHPNLDCIW